jgi:hypothetical protein
MSRSPSFIHTFLFAFIISYACADFTGEWVLTKAFRGDSSIKIPQGDVSLSVTSSEDSYNIYIQASNVIKGSMTVTKELTKTKAAVDFDFISSTRMIPAKKFKDVELFLMEAIPDMKMTIVKDSGKLIWKGSSVTAIFSPKKSEE